MFDLNPEIICNIISKAHELSIEEDLVIPDDQDNLSDAEWKQILAEYQEDFSYIELKDLINDLEPDQQKEVIALMYIGRGDFDKDQWQEALQQAHSISPNSRANYLIAKPMLADYLEEGLAKFDLGCD